MTCKSITRDVGLYRIRHRIAAAVQRRHLKLERGLALHRMEPTRSLLLAGSFTPPATVAALTDNVPVAAATVGVVASVGGAWWSVSAARRSAKQASPVGYLLDVRDRLTPQTVASRARALHRGYRQGS